MKRLICTILLLAMLLSLASCNLIKNGHHKPTEPDAGDPSDEPKPTIYIYSVSSDSIHLEGCYHIDGIKEKYLKTTEDVESLLNDGYKLCERCFPPAKDPDPEEPEEPEIPKEQATFLINKSSKKMHHVDCHTIGEMVEPNMKYTDLSYEQLLEDDYAPCGHCMPEQYEQYKKDHPEKFPEKD